MNIKRIESTLYSTVGVIAMFLLLLAVNFIAGGFKQRIDLTAEKVYTLSPGTKQILTKLDTPVKIRFYCTQGDNNMPSSLKTYAQRVEDLLAEYKQIAKDKLVIEKLNPEPDSEAEDSANLEGVEGQQLNTGEKVYLGLSVSCLDSKLAIAFLAPDREKLLEYDISRIIAQATRTSKEAVGVMSGLPIFGMPMNPMMMQMGQQPQESWIFISELKRDFDVRQLDMNTAKIDDDIKVLVVVHPRDISEQTQYAIDQFIMRGGRLIAFLDPLCVVDSRGNNPQNPLGSPPSSSSLDRLLKAWGLEMDKSRVLADLTYASKRFRPEVAALATDLSADAINQEDALTTQIDNILMPYTGGFTGTPVDGLKETVLIKSSKNTGMVEGFLAKISAQQAVKEMKQTGKEYALALRLSGKFKTAFPEGKPPEKPNPGEPEKKPEAKTSEESLKESKSETAVILVADADMLNDQFCVQVQNLFGQKIITGFVSGNLTLVQNFVEQLSGDTSLIGSRSRATMTRPFTRIRKMEADAEEHYRSTIKEIEDSLADTQQKINQLQQNKDKSQRFILSPEQKKEVENFKKKESDSKKKLKEVRKNLRQDVERLQNTLKWKNILVMPIVVIIFGIVVGTIKKSRTAVK